MTITEQVYKESFVYLSLSIPSIPCGATLRPINPLVFYRDYVLLRGFMVLLESGLPNIVERSLKSKQQNYFHNCEWNNVAVKKCRNNIFIIMRVVVRKCPSKIFSQWEDIEVRNLSVVLNCPVRLCGGMLSSRKLSRWENVEWENVAKIFLS